MEEQAPPKKINHILAWMPNWIGDVVFALPALQGLHKQYPEARITAVVRPPSNEILVNHPDIDCVIPFPLNTDKGTLSQIRFAFGLRKYHFDLAVIFPNSMRSAWLALMSGAPRRIGYETDGRNFLLTDPLPVVKESRSIHGVDYYAGIVKPLGVDNVDRTFPELVTEEGVKRNGELMEHIGMNLGKCLIAVSPGASKPEKRWHTERFGILCQKLIKEKKATILLMGSRKERPLLEQVARFCPEGRVFIIAGLNMQVVAGFLRNCRMLIANDSGLMNFAAMINTPVVGLFGPGHPKTTDPLIAPERKELVSLNFKCSPCRHKFFKDCEPSPHKKPFCLEDITVTQVADAVEALLERTT